MVPPGEVTLSLDVRHPRDASRRAALTALVRAAKQIARRRRLTCDWRVTQENGAVNCAPKLTALLSQSVRAVQRRSVALVSGAGHDTVVMSALTPVAIPPGSSTSPVMVGVKWRMFCANSAWR